MQMITFPFPPEIHDFGRTEQDGVSFCFFGFLVFLIGKWWKVERKQKKKNLLLSSNMLARPICESVWKCFLPIFPLLFATSFSAFEEV